MSMIFPGMDPYLEDPLAWQGVHNSFVVYLRDHLQPLLAPRYIAAVEERVFVEGPNRDIIPDVWITRPQQRAPESGAVAVAEADDPRTYQVGDLEIHESFIEILDRQSGLAVVTVIELVSPTNKFAGPGRESYLAKQKEIRHSQAHLVEIDLLRAGGHVVAMPEWMVRGSRHYDYLVSVNRAKGPRWEFEIYSWLLRQRLPRIRVPLAAGDSDVRLDLQAVLAQTYEAGSYRRRLRYERPCVPPLHPEDQTWANQLIAAAKQT